MRYRSCQGAGEIGSNVVSYPCQIGIHSRAYKRFTPDRPGTSLNTAYARNISRILSRLMPAPHRSHFKSRSERRFVPARGCAQPGLELI